MQISLSVKGKSSSSSEIDCRQDMKTAANIRLAQVQLRLGVCDSCMERFERFRFLAPRDPLGKGFLCILFSYHKRCRSCSGSTRSPPPSTEPKTPEPEKFQKGLPRGVWHPPALDPPQKSNTNPKIKRTLKINNLSETKVCTGDFAPPEPEFRPEFCETNFGRPNFGPEFLGRIF